MTLHGFRQIFFFLGIECKHPLFDSIELSHDFPLALLEPILCLTFSLQAIHSRNVLQIIRIDTRLTDQMPSAFAHSAPLQVRRPAGQLRHVSAGGEEVPVRLVRRRGPMHHEAALSPRVPLRQPLAGPVEQERQVHQPADHRGQWRVCG